MEPRPLLICSRITRPGRVVPGGKPTDTGSDRRRVAQRNRRNGNALNLAALADAKTLNAMPSRSSTETWVDVWETIYP